MPPVALYGLDVGGLTAVGSCVGIGGSTVVGSCVDVGGLTVVGSCIGVGGFTVLLEGSARSLELLRSSHRTSTDMLAR